MLLLLFNIWIRALPILRRTPNKPFNIMVTRVFELIFCESCAIVKVLTSITSNSVYMFETEFLQQLEYLRQCMYSSEFNPKQSVQFFLTDLAASYDLYWVLYGPDILCLFYQSLADMFCFVFSVMYVVYIWMMWAINRLLNSFLFSSLFFQRTLVVNWVPWLFCKSLHFLTQQNCCTRYSLAVWFNQW